MSNYTPLNKTGSRNFLLMVLAVISLSYVSVQDDVSIPYRQLAMAKPLNKMEVLGKHDHNFRHTNKLRGPMTLTWSLIGDQPTSAGDIFELEATFVSEVYIESVNAQLVIPPGVELVKGTKNFEVTKLAADEPQKIRFVFKQTSNRNEQVHLVAAAEKPGMRFADSIQFNTLLEPAIKQEKEILLRNSMQEHSDHNKVSF